MRKVNIYSTIWHPSAPLLQRSPEKTAMQALRYFSRRAELQRSGTAEELKSLRAKELSCNCYCSEPLGSFHPPKLQRRRGSAHFS